MITYNNAENIIQTYIPELKDWQCNVKPLLRIYSMLNKVTDLTVDAIKNHQIFMVKKYLLKMGNIFSSSDDFMKTIIKKIYFESLRRPLILCSDQEIAELKSIIPSGTIHLY